MVRPVFHKKMDYLTLCVTKVENVHFSTNFYIKEKNLKNGHFFMSNFKFFNFRLKKIKKITKIKILFCYVKW
jgi:phosphomevalonate kinase